MNVVGCAIPALNKQRGAIFPVIDAG